MARTTHGDQGKPRPGGPTEYWAAHWRHIDEQERRALLLRAQRGEWARRIWNRYWAAYQTQQEED